MGREDFSKSREFYTSGEVARKLNVPRRTITYRAAKGRIPGQFPYEQSAHRRYRRGVIDQLAEGRWPPIKASVNDGVLEIELRGLASEPFRVFPCPGELPEINAPELRLPGGGPVLPRWHLPRIASPIEVIQRLQEHLWN